MYTHAVLKNPSPARLSQAHLFASTYLSRMGLAGKFSDTKYVGQYMTKISRNENVYIEPKKVFVVCMHIGLAVFSERAEIVWRCGATFCLSQLRVSHKLYSKHWARV